VIPGSSPRLAAPTPESSADASPIAVIRMLREWPDAAARVTIVAVAGALFWLTWAHWGDIQLDNGRELYVPMQILRGKLLYRDIYYAFGPLAPYGVALLLGLFGQHLYVLYILGLATTIADALLLFDIGLMVEGRAVGLTAALALLLQGFQASSFNYVFPWSYAGSLGLMCSLLFLCLTLRHTIGRTRRDLMLAGLAAGLALLCKQEFGAACYVLLALVLVAEAALQRSTLTLLNGVAACTPGVLLWVVVYGWFFWMLTPGFMVFYNWVEIPGSYYMRTYGAHWAAITGLRFIPLELAVLVLDAGVALVLWYLVAKASRGHIAHRSFAIVLSLLALGMVALRHFAPAAMHLIFVLFAFPPSMFFIGCAFLAYTLYELRRNLGDRRLLAEATLALFALILAIRVLAQVVPFGYSIFYDMPLFLVFIIAATECICAAAPAISARLQRKLVNSLLATEVIVLAIVLVPGASQRTARLETSCGPIYLQPAEASVAGQIINFITEQKRQGRRIALLPELPMLYALTGTQAPSRLYTLVPGCPPPEQERDYISDLKRVAPDYIILTNRYTGEYGPAYFGINYDRQILHWIEANYRITSQFGHFRRDRSRTLAALLYHRLRAWPDRSHAPSDDPSHIEQK
jgi:hypothetical protein